MKERKEEKGKRKESEEKEKNEENERSRDQTTNEKRGFSPSSFLLILLLE